MYTKSVKDEFLQKLRVSGRWVAPRCIDWEVKPILRSDEEKELGLRCLEEQRKLVVKNFSQTVVKNALSFL